VNIYKNALQRFGFYFCISQIQNALILLSGTSAGLLLFSPKFLIYIPLFIYYKKGMFNLSHSCFS